MKWFQKGTKIFILVTLLILHDSFPSGSSHFLLLSPNQFYIDNKLFGSTLWVFFCRSDELAAAHYTMAHAAYDNFPY